MRYCKKCGNQLSDDAVFCSKCGENNISDESSKNEDINPKKEKNKFLIPIISLAILLGLFPLFFYKDNLLVSYYNNKGDKESLEAQKIVYYTKALETKYNSKTLDKISATLKNSDNPQSIFTSLDNIVSTSDLNNLHKSLYINKAKENFNNENYETTWKYLNKASNYGYNINDFEYYDDLVNSSKDNEPQKEIIKEKVYVYKNNTPVYADASSNYYFIPDSNIRYLTSNELSFYDKESLGFIRNEIFARHGYVFKTEPYKSYFNSMPWYYQDPTFSGSVNDLNKIERANINLIKKFE